MERIKSLNRYQKGVLIIVVAIVIVFTVIYTITVARKGFEYNNAILVPAQENGNTVYSGKIRGEQAIFTVYADKTVEFRYGNKLYGPYTAKEDPSAIPKDDEGEYMTGVELRQGDKILFRGGMWNHENQLWLYNEDEWFENIVITATMSDGTVVDEDGNVIDPMEPSVPAILELITGPSLTHKGEWFVWFIGVFLCIFTVISVLFADELFRLHLIFRIRDVEYAEPSDWEIAGRYISWTVLPIAAIVIFVMGLQ